MDKKNRELRNDIKHVRKGQESLRKTLIASRAVERWGGRKHAPSPPISKISQLSSLVVAQHSSRSNAAAEADG